MKSRDGEAGRPAADPTVMLALWLYAAVEGVGSARELERLAESDAAYRWLAGGVPLNYHGLADFRVEQVIDERVCLGHIGRVLRNRQIVEP